MVIKWRCSSKTEYGRVGYRCNFVPVAVGAPVSEEHNGDQVVVNGNIDMMADDEYAAILAPIKVRTLYDSLPNFEKSVPTISP